MVVLFLVNVILIIIVLGLITPPVGAVLFVTCGMSKLKLGELAKGIWPPFWVSIAVLLLVTYIPP